MNRKEMKEKGVLLLQYPEETREKIKLARDIFCQVFDASPNCIRYSKQRKCANAKKGLSYFYYYEMGLTLEEVQEAIGIDFSTVHYHVKGSGSHEKVYVTDSDYRNKYLDARYRYYQTLTDNVPTNGSTD